LAFLDKDRFWHEKEKSSDWFLKFLICNFNAREQCETSWKNNFNQFLLASYWSVFWDISTTNGSASYYLEDFANCLPKKISNTTTPPTLSGLYTSKKPIHVHQSPYKATFVCINLKSLKYNTK
jgi:hypothetical protein